MNAELVLDQPWLSAEGRDLGNVVIRRGPRNVLAFPDGIQLAVRAVDPFGSDSAEALIARVREEEQPGSVVLVAGVVPLAWRSSIRGAHISWIDPSGVVELIWPRLRVSGHRASDSTPAPRRRREPIPLQKGRGLVVQELCIRTLAEPGPVAIADLASATSVSLSVVSRTVSELAEHGYVHKEREGRRVAVRVEDPGDLAELLAARTAWPKLSTLPCYGFGTTPADVAQRVTRGARERSVDVATTGRVGAQFYGIPGTTNPTNTRFRVGATESDLPQIATRLGLESVAAEDANVVLGADQWGLGSKRAADVAFDGVVARVAHPLRVWCDLFDEPRGTEFAVQLWGGMQRGD